MKKLIRDDVAKSYLTKRGQEDTHWGDIIIRAEKRGMFTTEELAQAAHWQTCACGQQDSRIPRWDEDMTTGGGVTAGAPVDVELATLGEAFYQSVFHHDFTEAAKTLVQIEARAEVVLAMATAEA